MRTIIMRFAQIVIIAIVLTSNGAFAQMSPKPAPPPVDSEQALRDMVTELRLIRAEMRRISINAHRSQVVLDRIKLQQEHVFQIRHEITEIRDRLDEVRGQQVKMKQMVEKATKDKDAGLGDDAAVKAFTDAAEELDKRERSLAIRESLLATQLSAEEGSLAALNGRLDEIELEMLQPAAIDDGQLPKRKQ